MNVNWTATKLLKPTLDAINDPDIRYVVHVGSTRSSKTHSILQSIIIKAIEGVDIDVFRKELRVLKDTAYDDFISLLKEHDIYNSNQHELTKSTYHFNGRIRFAGADKESKLRGMRSDIRWANEANEITHEDWRQIKRRTSDTIIVDYNPTQAESHWLSDVIKDKRSRVIRSTYKCNPFLPEAQIKDIESDVPVYKERGRRIKDWDLTYAGDGRLVEGDPVAWAIYGLGVRASSPHLILQKRKVIPDAEMPEVECYGLDFGYAHPLALVAYGAKDVEGEDENACFHQLIHRTRMTTDDLIERMDELQVHKRRPIYCDHDPEKIAALRRAGYNAKKAIKDVQAGLDWMQSKMVAFTESSTMLQAEAERYRRKAGSEKPVKDDDDGIDACFAAGTMVTTDRGQVPIEDIEEGDKVLTRQGYKRVLSAGTTGERRVYNYSIAGHQLTCTPEHRIWTTDGWTQAQNVTEDHTLCLQTPSNSRESSSAATPIPNAEAIGITTLAAEAKASTGKGTCTEPSTPSTMAKSPRATTCTTKTGTALTTTRVTSKRLAPATIACITKSSAIGSAAKSSLIILPQFATRQKNGTPRKKAANGTQSMARRLGKTVNLKSMSASSAGLSTKPSAEAQPSFALTPARPSTAASPESMMKSANVNGVGGPTQSTSTGKEKPAVETAQQSSTENAAGKKQKVYNLEVEDQHEYFADGVLVHNCRYAGFSHNAPSQQNTVRAVTSYSI